MRLLARWSAGRLCSAPELRGCGAEEPSFSEEKEAKRLLSIGVFAVFFSVSANLQKFFGSFFQKRTYFH
jgi:hypothetical protein